MYESRQISIQFFNTEIHFIFLCSRLKIPNIKNILICSVFKENCFRFNVIQCSAAPITACFRLGPGGYSRKERCIGDKSSAAQHQSTERGSSPCAHPLTSRTRHDRKYHAMIGNPTLWCACSTHCTIQPRSFHY